MPRGQGWYRFDPREQEGRWAPLVHHAEVAVEAQLERPALEPSGQLQPVAPEVEGAVAEEKQPLLPPQVPPAHPP